MNLLPIAMRTTAILNCNQEFLFYKWIETAPDAMGRDVPRFDEPICYVGSIQPVSNKLYEQLGLDITKNYKILFCPELIQSLAEQIQPDRIFYQNKVFEIVDNKNWHETNGWIKALIVEIKEKIVTKTTNQES